MSHKKHKWFNPKGYLHIGLKLNYSDLKRVSGYVKNPDNVRKHSFSPLIHNKISDRRFRKSLSSPYKRVAKIKEREIFYATHFDAAIMSYYSSKLASLYERSLSSELSECITAYRKIHKKSDSQLGKCNIQFAQDVFNFIQSTTINAPVVIAIDIKAFFDSLDHKLLKDKWSNLIDPKRDCPDKLPKDHFNIYKFLCKYSYIDIEDLFNEFKSEIPVKRNDSIELISFKHINHLRKENAVAFCFPKDVKRLLKKKLIKFGGNHKYSRKKTNKGIPQGLPISSFLANLYMLDFDEKIFNFINNIGGLYRRYSDDIILVCPNENREDVERYLQERIDETTLKINKDKTQRFIFDNKKKEFNCIDTNRKKNLNYLGFEFDGKRILLKSSSISSFWRKYKQSLHRSQFYAKHTSNKKTKNKIFERRLIQQFTHLGAKRKLIYLRDKNNPSKFNKTTKYNWGNYISYVKKASIELNNKNILKQLNKHWDIIMTDLNKGKVK